MTASQVNTEATEQTIALVSEAKAYNTELTMRFNGAAPLTLRSPLSFGVRETKDSPNEEQALFVNVNEGWGSLSLLLPVLLSAAAVSGYGNSLFTVICAARK